MDEATLAECVSSAETIQMVLPSKPQCLCVVRAAVESLACSQGFGKETSHRIALAVNEALANVIMHAYRGAVNKPIRVYMRKVEEGDHSGLGIVIRDYGHQVDPSTIKGRDLDEVRPGGLGVHIIKTVMDRVQYSCLKSGGMCLEMVKYKR